MIKDLKVNKDTRVISKSKFDKIGLGIQNDNEADVLRFSFDQEFLGQATLLTDIKDINDENIGIPMNYNENDKTYDLILTKEMLTNENITFQLQVVNGSIVWNSRKTTLPIFKSLKVGEGTLPSTIELWLTNANKELYRIIESEKNRESNETFRLNQEKERASAESSRQSNEQVREDNESARISNESSRGSAESIRENNEQQRISNEDVRKANEITRKENEVNREKYISDLKQDVADGKFDGEDYILTEQDEDNIADKVKIKLEPTLEANLKASKDYTDNANIFDIKNVEFNQNNGSFTFTRHDDTKIIIDLPVELITKDGYYDSNTQELVLILMNNQEIRIPVSGLIDDYSTQDSTTIQLSISADNVITASIKGQSISKTHLTQELQDEINKKVNNDDYATNSKPGLIKTSVSYATGISADGSLMAGNRSLEAYKSLSNYAFLSKGTNEAIKGDYVKEAVQLDEVKEELHNQGFVKDDDLKPLKKKIDDNTDRIKRLEYDIYDSGEAEGSNIHIEDSTFAEAIEIGNEGVSNQKTTNGYNLVKSVSSYRWNDNGSGVSHEYVDDYVKVILPDEPTQYMGIYSSALRNDISDLEGKSVVYSFYAKADKNRTIFYQAPGKVAQIYVNLTTEWQRFFVSIESLGAQSPTFYCGTSLDNTPFYIKNIMMEKGSELHDYEKYTGGKASPNLDYPQDIEVIESGTYNIVTCGKNLYYSEKDEYVMPPYSRGFWYFVDGTRGAAGDGFANKTIFKAKVEKGKRYFFNADISGATTSQLVYSNENALTNNVNNFVFTASKDDYLILRMYVPAETECIVKNVYLCLYSDTHDYEPYIESKIEVTIPEGEFVAEEDEISVEWNEEDREYHKYLHKNIGRTQLTSTIFHYHATSDGNLFRTNKFDLGNKDIKCMCNRSINVINSGVRSDGKFYYNKSVQTFDFIYNQFDNLASFQVAIDSILSSGGKFEIYYPLKEPYKMDLGITDMSKTFTEITNVFSDHPLQPNLHIKYYRDFKKTIKELQDKVQTLETDTIKNTDYATLNKAGIVKANYNFATNFDSSGNLFAGIRSLDGYSSLSDNALISKGTLEAVLRPIRSQLEELSPPSSTESEVNNNDLLQE